MLKCETSSLRSKCALIFFVYRYTIHSRSFLSFPFISSKRNINTCIGNAIATQPQHRNETKKEKKKDAHRRLAIENIKRTAYPRPLLVMSKLAARKATIEVVDALLSPVFLHADNEAKAASRTSSRLALSTPKS